MVQIYLNGLFNVHNIILLLLSAHVLGIDRLAADQPYFFVTLNYKSPDSNISYYYLLILSG